MNEFEYVSTDNLINMFQIYFYQILTIGTKNCYIENIRELLIMIDLQCRDL